VQPPARRRAPQALDAPRAAWRDRRIYVVHRRCDGQLSRQIRARRRIATAPRCPERERGPRPQPASTRACEALRPCQPRRSRVGPLDAGVPMLVLPRWPGGPKGRRRPEASGGCAVTIPDGLVTAGRCRGTSRGTSPSESKLI
jgi:hypothetical protein